MKKHKINHTLLSYHEMPTWHQDNIYIVHGYRPITGSASTCFESLTYLHNESVNIYSHLIPGVLAILCQTILFRYLSRYYPNATVLDRLILALYLCTVATCFGLSTMFHILRSHSPEIAHLWTRIDFIGIIFLILGSFISGIYVGFYCEPALQNAYWAMILTLGFSTGYLVLHPSFQSRQYRSFRLFAFTFTGLSAFIPIVHASTIFPTEQLKKQSGLPYYYVEGVLILIGVLTYALRCPERFYPGRFDTWTSSHQIFHLLVVLATIVHFLGIMKAFDWNYKYQRCSASSKG